MMPASGDDEHLAEDLRRAMRALAKGVVVITARREGVRYAMAATAVTPVSMDPPSMLICVNETASIFPVLAAGASFCVNLLASGDAHIAETCSGRLKGEARFASARWRDENGIPILRDATASIICETEVSYRYGTHGLFIGQVKRIVACSDVSSLVYLDGCYLPLGSPAGKNCEGPGR